MSFLLTKGPLSNALLRQRREVSYHSSTGSSINNLICGIAFGVSYIEAPKVLTDVLS